MASENPPISFNLSRIKTEQFAIIESTFNKDQADKVKIVHSLAFGVNYDDRIVVVTPRFEFKQELTSFIILETSCHFRIQEDSWQNVYNASNNITTLSKDFALHLTLVAVGVSRGVLFAKTEQTEFNRYIIPLLSFHERIKEDVVLK